MYYYIVITIAVYFFPYHYLINNTAWQSIFTVLDFVQILYATICYFMWVYGTWATTGPTVEKAYNSIIKIKISLYILPMANYIILLIK